MPSDRPTRPHGTFTPASTIGRVLSAAGLKAFFVRKGVAFGGHRCAWDADRKMVRVGYWCGDDTAPAVQQAEQEERLTTYTEFLTSKGYHVKRTGSFLYVNPKKES